MEERRELGVTYSKLVKIEMGCIGMGGEGGDEDEHYLKGRDSLEIKPRANSRGNEWDPDSLR